jgi:hypothetical protein
MSYSFTKEELEQITKHDLNEEKIIFQLENFKKGFPFTQISAPCTLENGLCKIQKEDFKELIESFDKASLEARILKFVPASGAASRMFKTLQSFDNDFESIKGKEIETQAIQGKADYIELNKFIRGLKNFAFFDTLKNKMKEKNLELEQLIESDEYKQIINFVISENGLNYSNLPKGIIKFHNYGNTQRTAFEEHLIEGINYAKDKNGLVKLHFTISTEHLEIVKGFIASVLSDYEKEFEVKFEISYSIQKKATDTIAVDLENNLFKDKKNNLVFRPSGHGALIENLNDLQGDIIFIKNVDNVVPDNIKEETYLYKKLLGGYLIKLQNQIFNYLANINDTSLEEIMSFMEEKLYVNITEEIKALSNEKKKEFCQKYLNRPIRVCGMVKNQGEPGGGPFWVKGEEGLSLQIVESSQIDLKNESQKAVFSGSTHFNPVDLVCGVKDSLGASFNLLEYVDPNTGFISIKSKDGKDLKAMEVPGLWNGSMAYWNTIFVEVPIITFNPVKTVNDLLRKEHQGL